jgi:hypothetical protein
MMRSLVAVALTIIASSAAAAAQSSPDFVPGRPTWEERRGPIHWPAGASLAQGWFGLSDYAKVSVSGGAVDGDAGDLDQLPVIGGGMQWKLGGDLVDLGLESMLSFSGRADVTAFAAGGSGAAIAIDVDLSVFEIFGGPFASVFISNKLRVYGAGGPLLQWVDYQQSGSSLDAEGDGFGSGWYARAGVELALPAYNFIGIGVRWSDTRVDLGPGLGDLEIDGLQVFVTFSRGI